MSYRGRGRGGYYGNSGNYHNNQNQHQNQNNNNHMSSANSFATANAVPVLIAGWQGAQTFQECISFISRKCRIAVSNASLDPQTNAIKGYVKSDSEAKQLCDWSGVKFAGNSLKITKGVEAALTGTSGGPSTIEIITQFLKTRYNPEIKLLNLSAVKLDPHLHSVGFFANVLTSSKFFPALMKIAADLKINVDSVDLSLNELTDLSSVSALPQTFPKLKNLALLNNNFSKLKPFELWKHKLNFLRELVLINNPLINQAAPPANTMGMGGVPAGAQSIDAIRTEMLKYFPRLIVLNGEIVRDEAKLANILTFPFSKPQLMFFQDETIQQVSTNFVTNFFNLWDTNRQDLMVLYQQESQFSMQVDTSHPHSSEVATNSYSSGSGFHGRGGSNSFNSSAEPPFAYYISQSRNLTKVSNAKSRMAKLAKGQQEIFKLFQKLPKTRHDLMSQPQNFSMECYAYAPLNGIMVTIHGCFEEVAAPDDVLTQNTNNNNNNNNNNNRSRYGGGNKTNIKKGSLSKKSFDRTFVVLPGPNGSMIVASDMLTIRNFAEPDAWNEAAFDFAAPLAAPAGSVPGAVPGAMPGAMPGAAPGAVPGAISSPTINDLPMDVKANLNEAQQQILVRILLETKLNLQYGIMLCEQSQWDYQQCVNFFKQSEATLPREAYQ